MSAASPLLPGFHRAPFFNEQTREEWFAPGIRAILNAPRALDPSKPTLLVIYATPNGNTADQTLGTALADHGIDGAKTDWHFDIQHVAAQVRVLRSVTPERNVVLACIEAEGLSWPAWRAKHADNPAIIRLLVETLRSRFVVAGQNPVLPRVALTGHSGGGSFLWGFLNSAPAVPDWVERIGLLDANYSYSDDPADRHGDKLLAWLKADSSKGADAPRAHRLFVLAYDDRRLVIDGKPVVGPTGGTFRATGRMTERFAKDIALTPPAKIGPFDTQSGLDGRVRFCIHPNPENKILHTMLVGEWNGLLEALTFGTPAETAWGKFGEEKRAYTAFVQPSAWGAIPPRPADAPGGAAFLKSLEGLDRDVREERIAAEILRGNIPEFERKFVPVSVKTAATTAVGVPTASPERTATILVMPDYLAVGSDADWVRLPMMPATAQRIADAWGLMLTTRKLCDDIYRAAEVKLEPHPMTEAREAVATFAAYNALVEEQRKAAGKPLGALVAGCKKDVVVTNRLDERPNRVAIYGWHKLDGTPIQPLTTVHVDWYVDYSHGVRLISRSVTVDGRARDAHLLAHDAELCGLLSDEGPLERPSY